MMYDYDGLIRETLKRMKDLEEQLKIADTDAEEVIFYQLQAEKARLRLLLREAKKSEQVQA
ncbi:hypothetical protein [Caldanaerobacter subterraneus]|uniref:Uncharacterized protein n=1 Tax=Caldanaerobacter subterraneus TaxID=911092 RepID=A0A7Y2PLI4_9THEO|nr:hypothetical protein [Caldanaerobacter subterraneus]NNG67326.1 hypothetical protein [Caldanaerobacter subterraneus]